MFWKNITGFLRIVCLLGVTLARFYHYQKLYTGRYFHLCLLFSNHHFYLVHIPLTVQLCIHFRYHHVHDLVRHTNVDLILLLNHSQKLEYSIITWLGLKPMYNLMQFSKRFSNQANMHETKYLHAHLLAFCYLCTK